ncbi:capsid-related protein [Fadolivirus algeromassiliense]|jgi:hypothetical protein|uniref:Capsid-related protein n=1 Tax=Fadolivirus FV1/VV64 TaxID=3070911 RepID=A0A7D3R161_9VIRU|nr:capsid-related protein [Fadolivirus algeromassiliense]QKF93558.1 capsid-related protein [Fadolivirus FV1/VV64]
MSGGLFQLLAYGAQDAYLTSSPDVTFFRATYRKRMDIKPIIEDHIVPIIKEQDEIDYDIGSLFDIVTDLVEYVNEIRDEDIIIRIEI